MKTIHSRRVSFSSSSSSTTTTTTTVTYAFHNDQTIPHSQPIPIGSSEGPIPITVHHLQDQAQSNAAAKIQAAYRAQKIRSLCREIFSVNSAADDLQRLIQRQDTVDAVRSNERERLRLNESLMALLLRLDSVPGWDPAVREARRKVSRRIVGLQEILDAITEAKLEENNGGVFGRYCWGYDGFMRNWDEVVAEMEEEVCRAKGGEEMEKFCDRYLGFRCLQRFLREP